MFGVEEVLISTVVALLLILILSVHCYKSLFLLSCFERQRGMSKILIQAKILETNIFVFDDREVDNVH